MDAFRFSVAALIAAERPETPPPIMHMSTVYDFEYTTKPVEVQLAQLCIYLLVHQYK